MNKKPVLDFSPVSFEIYVRNISMRYDSFISTDGYLDLDNEFVSSFCQRVTYVFIFGVQPFLSGLGRHVLNASLRNDILNFDLYNNFSMIIDLYNRVIRYFDLKRSRR